MMYKKLDADDILEILVHYYQDSKSEFFEHARGILLGNAEEDNIRFIGVFGKSEDPAVTACDLEELDNQLEYNGDHAF